MKLQIISLLILIMLVANMVGCRRPDPEGHAIANTTNDLIGACGDVYFIHNITDEEPPVQMPLLIDWLTQYMGESGTFIDYRNKTMEDSWGRPVVIISDSGKFIGLGSSGPDGHWQNGDGDDIVFTLEDYEKILKKREGK